MSKKLTLNLYPPSSKSPFWRIRGSYLGKRVDRSSKARERAVARQAAEEIEHDIECGRFAEPGEPTFEIAAVNYMRAGGDRRPMGPLIEHFKGVPLKVIEQETIDAAALTLFPDGAPATRNREVYTPISAVLKHAGLSFRIRWPKGWPLQVRRLMKPTGSMWVFGSMRMFLENVAEFEGWRLSHDVIWEKHNGSGLFNDRFRRVHESALHFYRSDMKWADVYKAPQFTNDARARTVRKKGRPAQWIGATGENVYRSEDGGPRLMRSVQFVRSEHGRAVHPTQKPLALVEPLLLYACPKGGNVLDPFAGSGTVGVMARRHGMDCTLIEADDDYHTIIEQRLRDDAPLLMEATKD